MFFKVALLSLAVFAGSITPVKHVDKQETECLAQNIYFEAPDESYEGKLAVATVTMNRVSHREFPKTVCGVVYQRSPRGCQFSWVCNPRKIKELSIYREAEKIAEEVLVMGRRQATVKNALFFHNLSVSPKWRNDMKVITQIGGHIFYGT
jgi:spore germination cell wall hydrolase CwlJ-like protein